jgi:poly [ADP-ribose] polymerase
MPAKLKAKQAKVDAKKADVSKSADKKQDSAKKVDLKSIPKTKANPKADPPVKATKSNVSAKSVTPAKDTKKSPLKKSATKQAPSPKKDPSPKKGLSPAKKGKRDAPVAVDKKDATSGVKKTKSDEQIVKVITKGGAAVDILVPNKESFRVYQDAGKNYSATLNQANLDQNNNKFYIIQVLLNETTGNIHVWNRWGRVGVPGQNALKGPMTKEQCLKEFNTKLHEKTVKGDYK